MPKQILPLKKTPSATKPLNQNNMVKPSSPSTAHLTVGWSTRCLYFDVEVAMMGMRARMLHAGAKMR